MSDVGIKTTLLKENKWETDLWSYLSRGNGTCCPVLQSCPVRQDKNHCLSENKEYCKALVELIDQDDDEITAFPEISANFLLCPQQGEIFKLIRRLARKHSPDSIINAPPVPGNLITSDSRNIPIEVRYVPLKAHRGSVWNLSDCWMIHLNSNDTPARQKFTLYHEIFHILAYCHGTPVLKKETRIADIMFNELLADHFAAVALMPENWVKERWAESEDIGQLAVLFDVPKVVVWFTLKHLGLM